MVPVVLLLLGSDWTSSDHDYTLHCEERQILLALVTKSHQSMVAALFRTIFAQPDAARTWDAVRDELARRWGVLWGDDFGALQGRHVRRASLTGAPGPLHRLRGRRPRGLPEVRRDDVSPCQAADDAELAMVSGVGKGGGQGHPLLAPSGQTIRTSTPRSRA